MQFALCSAAMVVENFKLIRYRLSPDCTVYCIQLGGGPQVSAVGEYCVASAVAVKVGVFVIIVGVIVKSSVGDLVGKVVAVIVRVFVAVGEWVMVWVTIPISCTGDVIVGESANSRSYRLFSPLAAVMTPINSNRTATCAAPLSPMDRRTAENLLFFIRLRFQYFRSTDWGEPFQNHILDSHIVRLFYFLRENFTCGLC